jgi:hypothetical protein
VAGVAFIRADTTLLRRNTVPSPFALKLRCDHAGLSRAPTIDQFQDDIVEAFGHRLIALPAAARMKTRLEGRCCV